MAHIDPAFVKQILNIAQRQGNRTYSITAG